MPGVIGLDVGGVNTKAVWRDGDAVRTVLRPYDVVRDRGALTAVVGDVLAELDDEPPELVALTMTAELSDEFRSKREGVGFVLDAVEAAVPGRVLAFTTAGALVSLAEARARPLQVAAANWVASALAIGGGAGSADAVGALAREGRVMVDAGAATATAVVRQLELGVARVVIGTESLPGAAAFGRLRAELPDAPLVLSLDLRAGRVVSPDPALSGAAADEALARFAEAGAREAIVLDLARVGSGEGPDVALLGELHARFPQVELLAGGGVRHAADLRALAGAGVRGALVATALHDGALGADELRAL